MENFSIHIPEKIIFGLGARRQAGKICSLVGRRALVVTGKSAMKRFGYLDELLGNLKENKIDAVVFSRIEPNPRHTTIDEGGSLARKEKCDFVLALGGGSAMDAAKCIAGVAVNEGSVWDYANRMDKPTRKLTDALPVVAISAFAGTGSEANGGAVVTNLETKEKLLVWSEALVPRFAIVDPELTLTVSKEETANGAYDIISHALDPYLTSDARAILQDRFAESICKTVMEVLPRVLKNPEDLDGRGHLAWCSAAALSGFATTGRGDVGWPLHEIEHPLSAHYDIAHGRGLALLMPRIMEKVASARPERIAQFGERVLGVSPKDKSAKERARETISLFKCYIGQTEMFLTMKDIGITDRTLYERIAEDAVRLTGENGVLDCTPPLSKEDIVEIFIKCETRE